MDPDSLSELLDATETNDEVRGMARLCVRVHRLTHAQAHRIAKWAAALPRIDVLADVTVNSGVHAMALLRDVLRDAGLIGKVRVFEFTSTDMERRYPGLRQQTLEAYRQHHMWMMRALAVSNPPCRSY